MQRTEFRKLKMFDKLQFIKRTLEYKFKQTKDEDMNYLIGLVDECLYKTSVFCATKKNKKSMALKKANEILDRLWIEEGLK